MKRLRMGMLVFLLIFSGLLAISCSEQVTEGSYETTETDIMSYQSVLSDQSTQPEQSIFSSSASQTEHSAGIISNPECEHSFGLDDSSFDDPPVPAVFHSVMEFR